MLGPSGGTGAPGVAVMPLIAEALEYGTCCRGITQFILPFVRFFHKWNEPFPAEADPHLPAPEG